MLHFLPQSFEADAAPFSEAGARLASIRNALRLVDPFGGGPASDLSDEEIAAGWAVSNDSARRCFDARSERTIGAATAGLEAIVNIRECGRVPHDAAIDQVAEAIREGLADLTDLFRQAGPARP
jgi:hypothetical protein